MAEQGSPSLTLYMITGHSSGCLSSQAKGDVLEATFHGRSEPNVLKGQPVVSRCKEFGTLTLALLSSVVISCVSVLSSG
jgi:hypothetical protein